MQCVRDNLIMYCNLSFVWIGVIVVYAHFFPDNECIKSLANKCNIPISFIYWGSKKLTVNIIQVCYRSSHQGCSVRKGVLRDFTKFTWKHLSQGLSFNNVAGPANLLKKRLWIKNETLAQVFSYKFCEISRNTFFHRTPPVAASVVYCEWVHVGMNTRFVVWKLEVIIPFRVVFIPWSSYHSD